MTKLPINEEKWGSIITTSNKQYVITFNCVTKKYSLYHKNETGTLFKVASSTDSLTLIKNITDIERTST